MVFQIKKIENFELDSFYESTMKELNSFFGLKWEQNKPNIILVKDRKTIDLLGQKKTEDWVVGWVKGNDVYLLSDKNYESESCHKYSKEEYEALLKHELAHCFSNVISEGFYKPIWLLEGISIFLSGQNKFKNKPKLLKNFIEFFEKGGKEVYSEAGFVVEYLVKKYGKEKLLSLLAQIKKAKTEKDFNNLFKSIYGFDLSYDNFKI